MHVPDRLTPLVHIITTGGTIAMMGDASGFAPVPKLNGEQLVERLPAGVTATIRIKELFNLPSDHIGPPQWIELHAALMHALADDRTSGVVITHGTDTLEETAWFLELTISSDLPIILAGAQRNASYPDSDGPRNLMDAISLAGSLEARGRGVLVVANGYIHSARKVTKIHTDNVMGFGSGEAGVLGYVDADRVTFFHVPSGPASTVPLVAADLPRVEIVSMYGGADGSLIRLACEAGARGIVLQALGQGNVNREMLLAIRAALEKGVAVAISTRVPQGRVRPYYGFPGGGLSLKEAGALFCGELSPQKARISLMLALQHETDPARLTAYFPG
jgi:L-asparaginase